MTTTTARCTDAMCGDKCAEADEGVNGGRAIVVLSDRRWRWPERCEPHR